MGKYFERISYTRKVRKKKKKKKKEEKKDIKLTKW